MFIPSTHIQAEIPLSQLHRPLTECEESGELSRELGMLPARYRQAPASVIQQPAKWSVRFVHVDRHLSQSSQPRQTMKVIAMPRDNSSRPRPAA